MTISERPLIPPFSAYNMLSEYISYSGEKLGQHTVYLNRSEVFNPLFYGTILFNSSSDAYG